MMWRRRSPDICRRDGCHEKEVIPWMPWLPNVHDAATARLIKLGERQGTIGWGYG
jgi:hypothetical protein